MSVAVWPPTMDNVVADSAALKVGAGLKVAVTVSGAAPVVTLHVVPEVVVQPLQLPKSEPAAGVAVRVTEIPAM